MTVAALPTLVWTASAQAADLSGYAEVQFGSIKADVIAPARSAGRQRTTLANPAQGWLDRLRGMDALAVRGVTLNSLEDLVALHGYVLEPAWRSGVRLLVECPQRLTQLNDGAFVDPMFEHPYTLERALHAATMIWRAEAAPAVGAASPSRPLDAEQLRAVQAPEGTVQIIAPAGSGKTTVLIERVRELLRRGVSGERILATTFNRDARVELAERLHAAGVGGVQARTFHSLGLWLLREERLTRPGGVKTLSLSQWKRLCAIAARDTGTWVDAGDARSAVSEIKLGMLLTPDEFLPRAKEITDGATIARIYQLYESDQVQRQVNDYDDMVMLAVRALRSDQDLRRRWQARFTHVLVDEYQDIEPAQELLVRILAAPQDAMFAVGDEDQTLYGFRRASVSRMIELDLAYPGLERVSLAHNYRCPPEIVAASRQLIACNAVRFPKTIEPAPGRAGGGRGTLRLEEPATQFEGAERLARTLAATRRGETVVLARTTNLLRTVALSCAELGVKISAPDAVFEPRGARQAIEAYLRLCTDTTAAQGEDVALVCRAPNRGLPYETEERVAGMLRDGFSFTESFAALPANERQRAKLDAGARVLDALAAMTDAGRFVRYLRGPGGLDEYFTEHEDAFGDTEQIELEVLDQAQAEASGKTVREYSALLQARADALREIRDDENGIELTTIHRAKGRQWPQVQLFACEEKQLPHARAIKVTPAMEAAGEGLEAERRLAYVAFTRAQSSLVLTVTRGDASRFLNDAGLSPQQPYQPPPPPPPPREERRERQPRAERRERQPRQPRQQRKVKAEEITPLDRGLREAQRTGLSYALRTAPDRASALEIAATALERRMVGHSTTSQNMTVAKLLAAVETLTDTERQAVVADARLRSDQMILARLDSGVQNRIARALRRLPVT